MNSECLSFTNELCAIGSPNTYISSETDRKREKNACRRQNTFGF